MPSRRKSPERERVERERYDGTHRTMRAQWARRLARAGSLPCARCNQAIYAALPLDLSLEGRHVATCTGRAPRRRGSCIGECWSTWELGHDDTGTHYTGPEHFHCNRRAGGRKGAEELARRRGSTISRPRSHVRRPWGTPKGPRPS